VAVAALVFALTAPLTYALVRVYERARVGVFDPALVLRSTHVDYLWRAAIASWWGATCALVVWLALRSRAAPASLATRLAAAGLAAGAVVAVLAWLRP
jgi:hypothetical protein